MSWKLKRVKQCAKCPWKVSTDPHDIPNNYSAELHKHLARTIIEPGSLASTGQWRVMNMRLARKPIASAGS
jgi:hypothetical protein